MLNGLNTAGMQPPGGTFMKKTSQRRPKAIHFIIPLFVALLIATLPVLNQAQQIGGDVRAPQSGTASGSAPGPTDSASDPDMGNVHHHPHDHPHDPGAHHHHPHPHPHVAGAHHHHPHPHPHHTNQ